MDINKITELQLQIIINNSLYKKNVIDESTFSKANEKLLKMLKTLQTAQLAKYVAKEVEDYELL